ncbi:RICIN domain-containing protein [Streptomyces sp. A1136]|uniref:RICIN domain-containing protein n=1 Tax=Streptomyces sp. A1136 TaxID=2563102 RepID=UPI00109EC299|nr:RICIN domain-containing protein [Streptomyces sp. A1136]THA50624.1 hypothetical protein E6R62_24975 [Streptomyces sp. A1136]
MIFLAGLSAAVNPASAEAATVDTGKRYVLVNRNSGKAPDDYDRSANDGANQRWRATRNADGSHTLTNVASGRALDVPSGSSGKVRDPRTFPERTDTSGGRSYRWGSGGIGRGTAVRPERIRLSASLPYARSAVCGGVRWM